MADSASPFLRAVAAVGVSIVAHVVLVGAALALSLPTGWGNEAQPDPIAIEILTTAEHRDRPEEQVVAPESHDALPQPRIDEPRPPREPRHVPSNREVTSTELPTVEAPSIRAPEVRVEEPANREQTQEQQRRMQVLLNPANVARGSWRVEGDGPSMPGPPAGLGRDRPRTEQEIEAEHVGSLRAEAMAKRHITREPVVVQRRADGTYVHEGHRFSAVIRQDGHVEFQDRPAVESNGFSASGSFDLGDLAMQGSGQDPHRAERDRFMRETQELRDRLEAEHRRLENARGLRALRGRLVRVWAAEERTTAARRRRLFGIWDEMETGEAGREARAIVMQFIRDTIPPGHAEAYTPQEIARFNAARESREEFAPY